jgi:hypothetical protein
MGLKTAPFSPKTMRLIFSIVSKAHGLTLIFLRLTSIHSEKGRRAQLRGMP